MAAVGTQQEMMTTQGQFDDRIKRVVPRFNEAVNGHWMCDEGRALYKHVHDERRLLHYGQTFQSHALHFFHLASPDLLFGFDSDVARRNIVGVIAAHPETALRAVAPRGCVSSVEELRAWLTANG